MTEPLIVVEGTLRLPSLHPLTDPLLRFGREWSSGRMRPPRSNSEISLFAARLETAYTAAVSLADRGAPYRPMSLWSVIPNARMRQSMVRLMQGQEPDDRPAPVAEPIPLTVQTLERAGARPSHVAWLPTPLKTAAALACAALVLWLIFSHDTHLPEDVAPVAVNKTRDANTPASNPVASTAPTPKPVAKETVAVPVVSVAPIAPKVAVATAHVATSHVAPADIAPAQKQTAVKAKRVRRPSPAAEPLHATNDRKAAKHASKNQKVAKKRSTPRTTYANDTYADDIPHRPARARSTDYAPRAMAPVTPAATRPARAMTTQSLYDMLQHSPTLDNNFDAGVTGGGTRRVSAQ